jgi:hypothetical protein
VLNLQPRGGDEQQRQAQLILQIEQKLTIGAFTDAPSADTASSHTMISGSAEAPAIADAPTPENACGQRSREFEGSPAPARGSRIEVDPTTRAPNPLGWDLTPTGGCRRT